jgi:hypothetical protein
MHCANGSYTGRVHTIPYTLYTLHCTNGSYTVLKMEWQMDRQVEIMEVGTVVVWVL